VSLLLGIPTFFVILAILIMVHEIGHFSAAKLCGIRVDEFAIGFPPRLKTWRHDGTLYSLNAIPLGGFVRMQGENGSISSPDSFGAKPQWQRFVVLAAGPAMNVVLAIAVLFIVFLVGSPRNLSIVTSITSNSPAQHAGLRPGDRILALDSIRIRYLDQLQAASESHQGKRVRLLVRRGGRVFSVSLVPRYKAPRIGVDMTRITTVHYGAGASLRLAFGQLGDMVASLPVLARDLLNHDGSQVAGPVGIAQVTTQAVSQEPQNGIGSIFFLVALLSANLGILNLLPVPALDGGRIVFVLISWLRRRNFDPEIEGLIHMAGMAALLLLILVVSYQDVVRWVSGGSF
jgi:regulator of sigma E protease